MIEIDTIKQAMALKPESNPTITVVRLNYNTTGYVFNGLTFTSDFFKNKDFPVGRTIAHCVFRYCSFNDIAIEDCVFDHCDFTNCLFDNTDFTQSCVFSYCDFEECRINFKIEGWRCFLFSGTDFNSFKSNTFYGHGKMQARMLYEDGYDIGKIIYANSFYEGEDLIGTLINEELLKKYVPMFCPAEGSFIGYKVVRQMQLYPKEFLVKLLIPEDAERTSGYFAGGKCRASKVIPLEIVDEEGKHYDTALNSMPFSSYANESGPTTYELNKAVYADSFNDNRTYSCTHGIHFFIDKRQAMVFGNFNFKGGAK